MKDYSLHLDVLEGHISSLNDHLLTTLIHMNPLKNRLKALGLSAIVCNKIGDDNRKNKLYILYSVYTGKTNQELADEVGISLRTCQYWLKELEELGVITLKRDKNT